MTTARMIAAQIAVQKKSSIVRWLESASVMLRRIAFTITANSPSVRSTSGGEDAEDRPEDRVHEPEHQGDPQVAPEAAGDLHAVEYPARDRECHREHGPPSSRLRTMGVHRPDDSVSAATSVSSGRAARPLY